MNIEEQSRLTRQFIPKTPLRIKGMEEQKVVAKKEQEKKVVKEAASQDEVNKAVDTANKMMALSSYHMQFRVDKDSERIQVKLYDDETNEVIREIPPDEMLELSAKIKEMIDTFNKWIGVFVDEIV